jgi:prophage maintenance system killer protein
VTDFLISAIKSPKLYCYYSDPKPVVIELVAIYAYTSAMNPFFNDNKRTSLVVSLSF